LTPDPSPPSRGRGQQNGASSAHVEGSPNSPLSPRRGERGGGEGGRACRSDFPLTPDASPPYRGRGEQKAGSEFTGRARHLWVHGAAPVVASSASACLATVMNASSRSVCTSRN